MTKLSRLEKETQFLYNKHNKTTKHPLEIEKIEFPPHIIKILEKTKKRTKTETKKLTIFRGKTLYDLSLKSWSIQLDLMEKKENKRKEIQQKLAINKDLKYRNDPTKVKHFGIWFDNDLTAKLNRETYALIDKKVHQKPSPALLRFYEKHPAEHNRIYEDEQCTIYSDDWCEQHRQNCLKNFDLNMAFCSKIEKEKFEKALSALLKRRKNFKQIYDLNECDRIEGIYALVLDEYKQIYIGQSKDIKKRILQHWRKKKEFDRLLCGRADSSILSIDVFGFLDTTRIFVLKTETLWDLDNTEVVLLNAISKKYLLNRTAGGIHGSDTFAMLEIAANINKRHL